MLTKCLSIIDIVRTNLKVTIDSLAITYDLKLHVVLAGRRVHPEQDGVILGGDESQGDDVTLHFGAPLLREGVRDESSTRAKLVREGL